MISENSEIKRMLKKYLDVFSRSEKFFSRTHIANSDPLKKIALDNLISPDSGEKILFGERWKSLRLNSPRKRYTRSSSV